MLIHDWPVRLHEEIGPGDEGTLGASLPWMRQLVLEGRDDPLVRAAAEDVVAASPHLHPVDALFRFVRALPYRYDEEILAARGVDAATSELLQGAPFQLETALSRGPAAAEGDCDDRAILLQALLESLPEHRGKTAFTLVRGPGRADYSHVYSELDLGGARVPLDTIFDGQGGRRTFQAGDEVGLGDGARDRLTVPVEPRTPAWLGPALVAGLLLLASSRRR